MDPLDVATLPHDPRAEAEEQEDVLVGRTLDGRYRLIRRLGRGGMGAVYEAEHLSLESRVAIKVLQSSLSTDEKYRKRFLREARAASAIESLNVVRSSDFGATEDGLLYFAMELMQGQDLEQQLAGGSKLDWSRFEPIIRQVNSAVGAAHKRGVIHRDIKPSNCFLCKTDAWPPLVKVLDFGIAKVNATSIDGETPVATLETLTATNELFGTIAYMAPELIEGQPADVRSDIYALGVLMFRALTGKLPFTSSNVYKVLQQHVATPVPSLRALVPEIPAAVESVVFRAMAKRPEHRYQSVAALEVALASAREGVIEPSVAVLSGQTEVLPREASSVDALPSMIATQPGADAFMQRIDDPGSLVSARSPRSSLLATLALTIIVASSTAMALSWSSRPDPEIRSTASAMPPSPAAPSPVTPAPDDARPLAEATPERAAARDPAPAASPPVEPGPAAGGLPSASPTVPAAPTKARPEARKRSESPSEAAEPANVTIDDLAGRRCPEALGGRFTIEGVLNGQGNYIDPVITGGSKHTRECIEAFIRTRSFGTGRSMQLHTVRLSPR